MRIRLSIALLALSLTMGCLSTEPVVIPTIETTGFASSLGITLSQFTRSSSGLYYRDVVVGSGTRAIVVGDTVATSYVGSLPTGVVFDRTTSPDTLLTFRVGSGRIIQGYEEGVLGMRVGGERQLIIPPALAYGAASDGVIPPYAILVFSVKLMRESHTP